MKGVNRMAVLSRDEFFDRVQKIVGTDTTDESLTFIEDMTDTYNSLDEKANGDGTDWEQRYKDLDESWKEKYKKRFFSGGSSRVIEEVKDIEEKKEVTYDDLFE
jgi:hypothetical protein